MNNINWSAYLSETLFESTLAISAAIAMVLLMRGAVRSQFGASIAYALWLLVPASLLAVLLPARQIVVEVAPLVRMENASWVASTAAPVEVVAAPINWTVPLWLAGVLIAALCFGFRQWRFQRALGQLRPSVDDARLYHAEAVSGLPAVIGCWKPRIVLPADFELRYSITQRRLMLAHERTHIRFGDLQINALLLLLRCLFWFNPLIHFVVRAFRHDQELACDQRVITRYPGDRRSYGEAIIHTQLAAYALPLGCQWGFSHPLKERIIMLKRTSTSLPRFAAGASLVAALTLGVAFATWASQPATVRTAVPVVEAGQIRADMQLTVDGIALETVSVINKSAESFAVKMESSGKAWTIEGTATEISDGKIDFSAQISDQNGVVASPKLVVVDGEPAGIRIAETDNADVASLEMELTLTSSHFIPPPPMVTKADVAAGKKVPPPPMVTKADVAAGKKVPPPPASNKLDLAILSHVSENSLTPLPRYPVEARRAGVEGRVDVKFLVNVDGSVAEAIVLESTPPGVFDQAAIDAVKQWRLPDEIDAANPVRKWMRAPIQFKL